MTVYHKLHKIVTYVIKSLWVKFLRFVKNIEGIWSDQTIDFKHNTNQHEYFLLADKQLKNSLI